MLFLRVAWKPFEKQFKSIETNLRSHAGIVVRLANAEHHTLYKNESQDNERMCIYFYYITNQLTPAAVAAMLYAVI